MLRETEKINVLNYNENRVSTMVSPTEYYGFEPSADGITPTIIPMTLDQIRYLNNSSAFKSGLLFFEKDKEAEVYEKLGVSNWKDILRNEDIREIMLKPTYDGLQKILKIKDISTFERVRATLHKLNMEGNHDISMRVVQIVETRYRELQDKKVNTSIVLERKDIPSVNTKEVEDLKAQNKLLEEQMAKMQAMMEQLLKQNSSSEEVQATQTPKKTGRPKKATE